MSSEFSKNLKKTLKSFPFTAWKSKIFLKICYFKFKEFIVCGFYCLLFVMDGKLFPVALFETREPFEASHFFGILLQKTYWEHKIMFTRCFERCLGFWNDVAE